MDSVLLKYTNLMFYILKEEHGLKSIYRLLLFLHFLVGIGAMGGGMMAIINPEGPGGMPTEALNNSPFYDYFIPGIILFAVIGLGNVISAISILVKSKYQSYISNIFSWALVIWIIVQCIMLRLVVSLHVIFFIIGLIEAILAALILFAQRLFPANIILNIIANLEKKFPENLIFTSVNKFLNKISDAVR